ncbi:hypothetical protein [Bradyrhizobium sp. SZCCHNRI2049]|uniref:hypothetical protein n=1 Tax=Bradyrhizobium TaxID=374 RepID=UPI0029160B51|nr:hypothetical protein [Bradyrhizobium sp. SZCCHNRI2049]
MPRHFGLPPRPPRRRDAGPMSRGELALGLLLCVVLAAAWLGAGAWLLRAAVDRAEFISVLPTPERN